MAQSVMSIQCRFSNIWGRLNPFGIRAPLFTDRDYLNNTNNAGYYHPIKTLDCKKGQFHWSDLEVNNRLNAQITHF